MSIFFVDKVMQRLNQMIDNAMAGKPIENSFDETKMSALETKLSQYLALSQTSRKQLEEEKSKINALVSDISHQTKTPIANILLYSQLLEESSLSEQDASCVKALTAQAEKLNFLISSMVKTSRLESGIITVSPSLQPVQPLLESAFAQGKAKADAKSLSFICEPTLVGAVFDFKWTAEALYNLIDNAIKYTPQGGSIKVSVTPHQLFCKIDVTDTGIGISENDSPKVFSRFYRSAAVSGEEGVGLGLYLAREIVTRQRGYIKLSSKPGHGTTFSMFLPMAGLEI